MSNLSDVLGKGALLCGTQTSGVAQDMKDVLVSRLHHYQVALGRNEKDYQALSLESTQTETALEALCVLDLAQKAIKSDNIPENTPESAGPSSSTIGTRDLATLRTLVSIVFKWGIEPPYKRLIESWPGKTMQVEPSRIIDLTAAPQDYALLRSMLGRLLALIYPTGVTGKIEGSIVVVVLIDRHLTDLLRPCLALGWLPKSMSSPSIPVADEVRPMIMRLIMSLPAFQVIPALAAVLETAIPAPQHARKACSSLLSRQILRPDGLYGLYTSFFGSENEDIEEAPLEQLDHIYQLLSSVPSQMTPEAYFSIIVPRLVDDVSLSDTAKQKKSVRASAFVLSRMLSSDTKFRHRVIVSTAVKARMHQPLLETLLDHNHGANSEELTPLSPESAIKALTSFVANCDPSPSLISDLLSPVLPALYPIFCALQKHRTADPMLRDSVDGLLATWGRIVDTEQGITKLWDIIQDYDSSWNLNAVSQLTKSTSDDDQIKLNMFTPESLLRADEAGDLDVDANVMDLRPDPKLFTAYIKSINRPDIASELFIRLLEGYQTQKSDPDGNPLRTLLYLQLIMQMQLQIPPGSSKSDILKKPDHLLSFIKNALESTSSKTDIPQAHHSVKSESLGLRDLRIIEGEENDLGDSDDEDEESGDEEMISTATNLLLSILEIHPDLSVRNTPALNDIFNLLAPLALGGSKSIQALAREARLVITARLASTSSDGGPQDKKVQDEESPQEIYQKALKLLQDPILPVRAHGLLLLRQLVTTKPGGSEPAKEPDINRALVPAILSIFRQSLQDEDSYIFLNAVQGLSAMVETYGKEVLKTLVADFTEGLEGLGATAMSQTQVDVRVRIGEALGQVIRRCGSALGLYAELLIPRLFAVSRTPHFPAPLRVSALSLLALCASTYVLAIIPYARDLAEAMVDLLQLESSAPSGNISMDDNPTSTNPKVAPMRRGALHFLSLLIRACLETSSGNIFDQPLLQRMQITLRYIASTDVDPVVKLQARETLEGWAGLQGFA